MSDNQRRYMFYWLWVLASRFSPILVVGFKYDLFKTERRWYVNLGIIGIFLTVWGLLKFWSDFIEWIKDMEDGIVRECLLAFGATGPYILLWIAATGAQIGAEDMVYVSSALLIAQLVGVYFKGMHKKLKIEQLKARGHVRVITK